MGGVRRLSEQEKQQFIERLICSCEVCVENICLELADASKHFNDVISIQGRMFMRIDALLNSSDAVNEAAQQALKRERMIAYHLSNILLNKQGTVCCKPQTKMPAFLFKIFGESVATIPDNDGNVNSQYSVAMELRSIEMYMGELYEKKDRKDEFAENRRRHMLELEQSYKAWVHYAAGLEQVKMSGLVRSKP